LLPHVDGRCFCEALDAAEPRYRVSFIAGLRKIDLAAGLLCLMRNCPTDWEHLRCPSDDVTAHAKNYAFSQKPN